MKVVSAIKKLCKDCYFVRRGKRLYMRCTSSPRHKRRQGGFATLNYQVPAASESESTTHMRSYDGYKMQ